MATTSEVGISPVLLQAITHTLSGSASRAVKQEADLKHNGENRHSQVVIQTPSEEKHSVIKMEGAGHASILHGMSQPVSSQTESLQEPGETVIVVQTSLDESGDQVENVDPTHLGRLQRSHIIIKGVSGTEGETDNPTSDATNHSNVNMGSVLTAIASHLKNRSVNIPSKQHVQETESASVEVQHIQESAEIPQPIYVTYANNINVPSPSNDITVSTGGEIENVVTETVVQTSPTDLSSGPAMKRYKLDIPSDSEGRTMIIVNPDNLVVEGSSAGVETYQVSGAPFAWKGVTVGSGGNNTITTSGGSNTDLPWQPCPICGDRISGYHYGIYSCESCKGFFKRTVQNKKAFICHRSGECEVNIGNRKKCPACRFKRCLVTGMKLEAIREDRTRGGRSSYDGCSPHGRLQKPPPSPRTPTTPRIVPVNNNNTPQVAPVQTVKPQVVVPVTTATPQGAQIITMVRPMEEHVINGKEEYVLQIQPNVPQLLEDLMAVESLMSEDDGEQSCCEGRLQDGDTNLFGSVLHFADHCLYKIVRWARNLPDFARVCTDDQILLLQNCWAELLCLSCSYHSRTYQQKDQLRLAYGRLLDLETSRRMGLGEVAERLMGFAEHMCRLEVDAHEFVALKVLMLLTPDVKNLKDEDIVRSYQDQLCEALMVYTSSHYQHRPEKVCQMLGVLPEISRTCLISKDLLLQRQNAGDIPQYSLLSELLKGDITVQ